ncbi:MAG TPA: hypothetical protein V6D05_08310 [Stenomitos sp.]
MYKQRLILTLAALALAGCDSGLGYKADLGQPDASKVPSLTATETLMATAAGSALSLRFSQPSEWQNAQSVKVLISGVAYPLTATGSPTVLTTTVPNTPSQRPMNSNQATMSFVVNNDHVSVAQVTFQ